MSIIAYGGVSNEQKVLFKARRENQLKSRRRLNLYFSNTLLISEIISEIFAEKIYFKLHLTSLVSTCFLYHRKSD